MTPTNQLASSRTSGAGSGFGRKHREIRQREGTKTRVLVAGQVPPPVCGQNLNIARVLGLFRRQAGIRAEHWAFRFSPSWSKVRQAGWSKAFELVRVWGRLVRLRCRGRIDVILYPVGGPHLAPILRDLLLLPLACLASRRVILHFRAAGFAEAMPQLPGPLRWMIRRVYRNCGEAVVLTNYGRRDPEAAGIPKGGITVIPNGCEDRFQPGWKKSNGNGREETITILNVGLLCPDKGTPALVEAFSRLARGRPEIRLRLVGEPMGGSTAESLLEIAERHGKAEQVELSGVLGGEDLDRAFAEADLFVFPTVAPFESFGMVLIEAMMWKLPIVATDWRGNSEVMGPDPGGVIVAASDDLAGSLEFGIEELLENRSKWKAWGRQNRRRFLEEFRVAGLERRLSTLVSGS